MEREPLVLYIIIMITTLTSIYVRELTSNKYKYTTL